MTDRIKALIVTLDTDMRDDDVAGLIDAIRWMQHVIDVAPMVADATDYAARIRVDLAWRERIIAMLDNKGDKS